MRVPMSRLTMILILLLATFALHAGAIDVHQLRAFAAKKNVTCILVFGDSSVDPGNNNHLTTPSKCNFPPYGEDFPDGRPTGRFCNGRLATDFIAEAIFGYTNIIRGFLDPKLTKMDLLHGVSFASSGSGYDDYTANISSVLSIAKQLEYFKHYKIHLRQLVGRQQADEVIRNAVFVLSMGTNDFLQNYYVEPFRSQQFSVEEYEDYLISCLVNDIKAMHSLGARRLIIVGVPPFGCMPLERTLHDETKCDDALNHVAFSFNAKAQQSLTTLGRSLGMATLFADIYSIIERAIRNPSRYGFTESAKGCCGSGTYEYGDTCRSVRTCADRTKYIFWDAVHPTEKMYKILAEEVLVSITKNMFL